MGSPENNTNGWDQWQKHVLAELARMQQWMGDMAKEQHTMALEIAKLKVKATLWGLTGGLIPVVVMIAIQTLKN